MDPTPDPDPDPAIFRSELQDGISQNSQNSQRSHKTSFFLNTNFA
jgi:hypothetical protein